MTKKEATQILAMLKAAYPNFYKDMGADEAQGTISIWAMQFADLPAEVVLMALNKHISVGKFPPTIAEIKEKITAIYWEAHGKAYPLCENDIVTEEEQQYYGRLCKMTEGYKYKDEPKVDELVRLQAGNRQNVSSLPSVLTRLDGTSHVPTEG